MAILCQYFWAHIYLFFSFINWLGLRSMGAYSPPLSMRRPSISVAFVCLPTSWAVVVSLHLYRVQANNLSFTFINRKIHLLLFWVFVAVVVFVVVLFWLGLPFMVAAVTFYVLGHSFNLRLMIRSYGLCRDGHSISVSVYVSFLSVRYLIFFCFGFM